jgi:phage tail protein X
MARTYKTKSGDRWDGIAKDMYGSEKHADTLMQANAEYLDILQFNSGVTLTVPDIETDETELENLPPWRREDG